MAAKVMLGNEAEFHQHERKIIRVAIVDEDGDPVALTGVSLEFQLAAGMSSVSLITKVGAAITLSTTTIANDTAVVTLSETETGALPEGWKYIELWDRTNDRLLMYGQLLVQPGRPVVV